MAKFKSTLVAMSLATLLSACERATDEATPIVVSSESGKICLFR